MQRILRDLARGVRATLGGRDRTGGNSRRVMSSGNSPMAVAEPSSTEAAPEAHGARDPNEVATAWQGLKEHGALLWVPPMWRSVRASAEADQVMRRHVVSAVEQNLLIDVDAEGQDLRVRLATGPLGDRPTSDGVDPLVPAGGIDPKLDVQAHSFEEAIVQLYEAVTKHYGASEAPPCSAGPAGEGAAALVTLADQRRQ